MPTCVDRIACCLESDALLRCTSAGGGGTSAPGSIRDFFGQNSYYKAETLSTVLPWVTVDSSEVEASGPGRFGVEGDGLTTLCTAMVQALTYSITNNTYVDYSKFQMDDHDRIKQILFISSGYPAEMTSAGSTDRIWSHKSSFSTSRCNDFGRGLVDENVVSLENGLTIKYTVAEATTAPTANPTASPTPDGQSAPATSNDDAPPPDDDDVSLERTVAVGGYLVTNGCFGSGEDGDDCPDGARIGVVRQLRHHF